MRVQTALTVLLFLGAIVWTVRVANAFVTARRDPIIDERYPVNLPEAPPFVSVLVPARNEESNIASCVESLLNQEYPSYEVIVIDDRSEDRTGEILDGLSEEHDNLRVLHLSEHEDGWTGKTYALHRGVRLARGNWFLFTDADTRHSRWSLARSMSFAMNTRADMISLLPELLCHGFWENVVQPIAGGLLMLWYPTAVVNKDESKKAFANGQYILINKDVYHGVGGHESVKGELLEDIALAKRVKSEGFRVRVGYGAGTFGTRMYAGLKEIIRGWARIYYAALNRKAARLTMSLVLVFLLSFVPVLAFGAALFDFGGGMNMMSWLNDMLATYVFGATHVAVIRSLRYSKAKWWTGFFYSIACCVIAVILCEAIITALTRRGVVWRGVRYHGADA